MTSRIFNFYISSFEKDSGTKTTQIILLTGVQIYQGEGINVQIYLILVQLMYMLVLIMINYYLLYYI